MDISSVRNSQYNYSSSNNASRSSKQRISSKPKFKISKSISAADYMTRIADARTPSRVAAIMRVAKADVHFVDQSGAPKEDVEKAKRILKKVLIKSRVKIKRLKQEKEMEQQKKIAEKNKQKELTERLRNELSRKRRSRRSQEAVDAEDPEHVTIHSEIEVSDAAAAVYAAQSVPMAAEISAECIASDAAVTIDVSL